MAEFCAASAHRALFAPLRCSSPSSTSSSSSMPAARLPQLQLLILLPGWQMLARRRSRAMCKRQLVRRYAALAHEQRARTICSLSQANAAAAATAMMTTVRSCPWTCAARRTTQHGFAIDASSTRRRGRRHHIHWHFLTRCSCHIDTHQITTPYQLLPI